MWEELACEHLAPLIRAEIEAGNTLAQHAQWNDHYTFWLDGYRLGPPHPHAAVVRYVYSPDFKNGWIDHYTCRAHRQGLFRQGVHLPSGRTVHPSEIDPEMDARLSERYGE
ncbi:hypothetical protein HNP84_008395 [Thermocatellispora tengchongensis]|uniref:Uncharacterized protein n=1 Tax=Thermocatellispora tengchongensis TaxID=1073253 RepID=A0A840PLG7_9ACTN|nr:hypothetical protein [Thermocatellispora tengchongensis]MBB5138641.1 hypothetical protein [Thermocatellispora tengchongensis]